MLLTRSMLPFDDKTEEGVNPEDSVMPPFVAGMEGKTYTFQVR